MAYIHFKKRKKIIISYDLEKKGKKNAVNKIKTF